MKKPKAFWGNRSIATKLTLYAGLVLLAACSVLLWWLWNTASQQSRDSAGIHARSNLNILSHGIVESGFTTDPAQTNAGLTSVPAVGSEDYAKLKMLLVNGITDDNPCTLAYYDENGQFVSILSPMFLYTTEGSEAAGNAVRVAVDIGGLSVDDLREVFQTMYTAPPAEQGNGPYLTVYGKRYSNGYIEANRVVSCIDQTTWYAQNDVPEQESWRIPFQRRTTSNAMLDAWMDARDFLTIYCNMLSGNGVDAAVLDTYRTADFTYSNTNVNGIAVTATYVYDFSAEIYHTIAQPSLLIWLLFLLFVWWFHRRVCRLVTDPLWETKRQAQHVAHLEFDAFHPDTDRGDEIGDLNRALADMAGDLHRRWDSERDLEDRRQQFVAAASHDLKTPLALIGGYAEAIAQDISPEENARYLAAIEQEAGRMNSLVREMLDYTRLDRTEELANRTAIDLTALLRAMLEEYTPLFEQRRLSVTLADGVRIRGDETLLRRAFGCLLENAAKYSPENGHISVTLHRGGATLLTVENDCEPIPESELPRLFEMFYRGDKARDRAGGHGLGLAIMQKILALHSLACHAENTETGVRFCVTRQ